MQPSKKEARAEGPAGAGRAAAGWRRASQVLGASALTIGWLSPQYVAKLYGMSPLAGFLRESPVLAGFLSQCCWMVMLLPAALAHCARARGGPLDTLVPEHPPRLGAEWLSRHVDCGLALAVPFGTLVIVVHILWYASFSGTNVATNTVLWNTDTVTTPLLAMLVTSQKPTRATLCGGLLGMLGAGLAVGASADGDTLLGCGLCLSASLCYALNGVLLERIRDPEAVSVAQLLGLEGVVAAASVAAFTVFAAALAPASVHHWVSALPQAQWLLFLGANSLLLNIGWLWCIELGGALWTAMIACSTIPLTQVLDLLLLGMRPTVCSVLGSVLVLLGFVTVCWGAEEASSDLDEPPASLQISVLARSSSQRPAPPWAASSCATALT